MRAFKAVAVCEDGELEDALKGNGRVHGGKGGRVRLALLDRRHERIGRAVRQGSCGAVVLVDADVASARFDFEYVDGAARYRKAINLGVQGLNAIEVAAASPKK